ncbi:MAG: hypothetical protein HY779_04330, partial [Rubrobacteridae bacterium]|nr:hypothetical protein [Rubrobacteridae bacterium]
IGTTGATPHGSTQPYGTGSDLDKNEFGVGPNEAPPGMPSSYDAHALGCFWCQGTEKRAIPNNTDVVDLTKVLSAPNMQALGVAETSTTVSPLAGGNTAYSATDNTGIGEITVGNLLQKGNGLPVSGSRWTNMASQIGQPYGIHGGYTNSTDRCKVCHDVHAAAGSKRLTAGFTAEDICATCHDFTQGIGVYGAIQGATGIRPAGAHRIQNLWSSDQTTDTAPTPGYNNPPITNGSSGNNGSYLISGTVIPGYMPGWANQVSGYPQTGGVYTYTSASLASKENQLTCTDCHTPHGNTSMRPFVGDRVRFGSSIINAVLCMQPTHITWIRLPAGGPDSAAQVIYNLATGSNGATRDSVLGDAVDACGTQDLVLDASGPASSQVVAFRINLGTDNGRAVVIRILQIIGRLPSTTALDPDYWTDEGLSIDRNTSWGDRYATSNIAEKVLGTGHHITRIQNSGIALSIELFVNGLIDLKFTRHGISAAAITRVASNKMLRDFINGLDLRDPRYGGAPPAAAYRDLAGSTANDASGYSNYNESLQAPALMINPDAAGNTWNNGQANATAVYGSGFCAACHRGRIGNYVGLVNADDFKANGSRSASRLDADFKNIAVPPNAMTGYPVGTPITDSAGNTVNTMTDRDTCLNHPTLMKTSYNGIGILDPAVAGNYPGGGTNMDNIGSWGNPGVYRPLGNMGGDFLSGGKFGTLNGLPYGMERALGLSNQGFVMWPVPATARLHPDGRIGESHRQRPKAPICQQCHEDSRDVEAGFAYMDTDKAAPFAGGVNEILELNSQPVPFLNDGNPAFQNFPHETQNYRLLLEGDDSNRANGGRNDDLCLNCHVPGSTIRPGSDKIIFNSLVKDFNGFQE